MYPSESQSELWAICVNPAQNEWPRCPLETQDRKSTRLNSSHLVISYAVFCLKKKNRIRRRSGWWRQMGTSAAAGGRSAAPLVLGQPTTGVIGVQHSSATL